MRIHCSNNIWLDQQIGQRVCYSHCPRDCWQWELAVKRAGAKHCWDVRVAHCRKPVRAHEVSSSWLETRSTSHRIHYWQCCKYSICDRALSHDSACKMHGTRPELGHTEGPYQGFFSLTIIWLRQKSHQHCHRKQAMHSIRLSDS